jgi:hypothetical protein
VHHVGDGSYSTWLAEKESSFTRLQLTMFALPVIGAYRSFPLIGWTRMDKIKRLP